MPSGLIHDHGSMAASGNIQADLIQMRLHGRGIAVRSDQSRAAATAWANRAKYISVRTALIFGLSRPGSLFCPKSRDAVLLADAHLVLKPDFNGRVFG